MEEIRPHNPEIERSLDAFNPRKFGFSECGNGWAKEFPELGEVIFSPIGWQHVNQRAFRRVDIGASELLERSKQLGIIFPDDKKSFNSLEFLSLLQGEVWQMGPLDIVPPNVLSIIGKTGGSIIVAYTPELGFSPQGWLGFVFGFGSNKNVLVSHMLGVRPELRGKADIGFYLKLLQGYEALKNGYTEMNWTFDPARGLNAYLNLEKLGGIIRRFVINMYGELNSGLYGLVPTDRVIVEWNLTDPNVHQRIKEVASGTYRKKTLEEHKGKAAIVTASNLQEVLDSPYLLFKIPGDIDQLTQTEEGKRKAVEFRGEMRKVFSTLLDCERVGDLPEGPYPHVLTTTFTQGDYKITGFISLVDEQGQRKNYYLFQKKG
jgi:predicted GNAT superfamily acetyltransferase